MLHQTISHKLQRAFFLTFAESKQIELILHLKHLIEYRIILLQNFQEVGTYFTIR